jgi:hypothetical protein
MDKQLQQQQVIQNSNTYPRSHIVQGSENRKTMLLNLSKENSTKKYDTTPDD